MVRSDLLIPITLKYSAGSQLLTLDPQSPLTKALFNLLSPPYGTEPESSLIEFFSELGVETADPEELEETIQLQLPALPKQPSWVGVDCSESAIIWVVGTIDFLRKAAAIPGKADSFNYAYAYLLDEDLESGYVRETEDVSYSSLQWHPEFADQLKASQLPQSLIFEFDIDEFQAQADWFG